MTVPTILVTGADGFVGSHLVARLLRGAIGGAQPTMWVLTRRSPTAFWASLPEASQVVKIVGDCKDVHDKLRDAPPFDYVFHLAADARFPGTAESFRNNVDSTAALLLAISQQSASALKRFVFCSSIGAADRAFDDQSLFELTEDTVPAPTSSYGKSKLACEDLVAKSKLPYCILRPAWIYGKGMREDSHMKVLLAMVAKNSLASRLGFPGKTSLIHVEDFIDSLIHAAASPSTLNQLYFVSDGAPLSYAEIFRTYRFLLDKSTVQLPLPKLPLPKVRIWRHASFFKLRSLFQDTLVCNPNKIIKSGFTPKRIFGDYICELVESHCVKLPAQNFDERRTALITGASSGLGRSLLRQLYVRGFQVVAVDKEFSSLQLFANEHGVALLEYDLSKPQQIDLLLKDLHGHTPINWLINCAGVGPRASFIDLSMEQLDSIINVNIRALAALSHFQVTQSNSKRSILVNVSSSVAHQPLPFYAMYSASKSFGTVLSEVLEAELSDKTKVITVLPAGMDTNFQKANEVLQSSRRGLLDPRMVAAVIVKRGLACRGGTLTIGKMSHLMKLSGTLLPRTLSLRIWKFLTSKYR